MQQRPANNELFRPKLLQQWGFQTRFAVASRFKHRYGICPNWVFFYSTRGRLPRKRVGIQTEDDRFARDLPGTRSAGLRRLQTPPTGPPGIYRAPGHVGSVTWAQTYNAPRRGGALSQGAPGSLVQDSRGKSLRGVVCVSFPFLSARTSLSVPASVWCPYGLSLAAFRAESSPERPAESHALDGVPRGSVLEKLRAFEISAPPPRLAGGFFSRRWNMGPGPVPCGSSRPGSVAGSVGLRCRSPRVVISCRPETSAGRRLGGRAASAHVSVASA